MSDDGGPVPGIGIDLFFYILFLTASFLCTAFSKAAADLSDADLKEEEEGKVKDLPEKQRAVRSRLKDLLDQTGKLDKPAAFWQLVSASWGGVTAVRLLAFSCERGAGPKIGSAGALGAVGSAVSAGGLGDLSAGSLLLGIGRPVLAAVLLLLISYVFSVALPEFIGRVNGLGFLTAAYPAWKILADLSYPFTAVYGAVAAALAKLFRSDPSTIHDQVTEDEIISMVNEGHEQGTVDEDQAEMIRNIFELDEKQAQDIMTVRGKIIALDAGLTLDEAIRKMVQMPNSRFPVYEETIDNIIGALYLKDAMAFHMKEVYNETSIRRTQGLLREVKFVPEARQIDELFADMQKSQVQIAIVVDEYGETAGLVTMEDILEEIVGNIFDEYDRVERTIIPFGKGRWRISGMAALTDLARALNVKEISGHETLNGYLTAKLDHVPGQKDVGRKIEDPEHGVLFTIRSVGESTIQWALAEKTEIQRNTGQEK